MTLGEQARIERCGRNIWRTQCTYRAAIELKRARRPKPCGRDAWSWGSNQKLIGQQTFVSLRVDKTYHRQIAALNDEDQ